MLVDHHKSLVAPTLLSQLPTTMNVEGRRPGLKAIQLTLSSGGDVTSMSFIGFTTPGVAVLLNMEVVAPKLGVPLNKLIVKVFYNR